MKYINFSVIKTIHHENLLIIINKEFNFFNNVMIKLMTII